MDWKKEWKIMLVIGLVFIAFYYLPIGNTRFDNAVFEALQLAQWYAREHVILCLIPAFFIAGALSVFLSQQSVMKYLGAKANKVLAYGVASISGGILAVCSCTILPLFAGIHRMGAGLGPASTFLYSGPAINIMAIVLTAKVLGIELGIARAVGAILFSIIIGLLMQLIFKKEEQAKIDAQMNNPIPEVNRPLWQNAILFFLLIGILVFANWSSAGDTSSIWTTIYSIKWFLVAICALGLVFVLLFWLKVNKLILFIIASIVIILSIVFYENPVIPFIFSVFGFSYLLIKSSEENQNWFASTWDFAKQIMPLLFYGVLIAGFLLGTPGKEALIPSEWIIYSVGNNDLPSTLFASVVGAFMYFATLTEVPILQGLIGNGMAKGPALALLLAGPALSLPNMLVIKSIIGLKRTLVFVALVIIMSTITGLIYGYVSN